MGDQLESQFARSCENPRELARRMAAFGGIEPDAIDPVEPGFRFRQCGERRFLIEMAQEAHDQTIADAKADLALLQPAQDSPDRRSERDAAAGVTLRIEDYQNGSAPGREKDGQ